MPGEGTFSRGAWLESADTDGLNPFGPRGPCRCKSCRPDFLAAVMGNSIPGRLKPVRLSVQIRPAAPFPFGALTGQALPDRGANAKGPC